MATPLHSIPKEETEQCGADVIRVDKYDRKKIIDYKGIYGIERRRCKPNSECVALKEDGDTLNLIVTGQHNLMLRHHRQDDARRRHRS